jgi:hypothetical protein
MSGHEANLAGSGCGASMSSTNLKHEQRTLGWMKNARQRAPRIGPLPEPHAMRHRLTPFERTVDMGLRVLLLEAYRPSKSPPADGHDLTFVSTRTSTRYQRMVKSQIMHASRFATVLRTFQGRAGDRQRANVSNRALNIFIMTSSPGHLM